MKRTLLIAFMLLTTNSISAKSIYCSGKVENVYIDSAGGVVVKGGWRKSWTLHELKNSQLQ